MPTNRQGAATLSKKKKTNIDLNVFLDLFFLRYFFPLTAMLLSDTTIIEKTKTPKKTQEVL